jgi:hypothetical protein
MSGNLVVKFFIKAVNDFGLIPVGYIPEGGATWTDEEAAKLGFIPCEGQLVEAIETKWPDLASFLRENKLDRVLDMRAEFLVAEVPS